MGEDTTVGSSDSAIVDRKTAEGSRSGAFDAVFADTLGLLFDVMNGELATGGLYNSVAV